MKTPPRQPFGGREYSTRIKRREGLRDQIRPIAFRDLLQRTNGDPTYGDVERTRCVVEMFVDEHIPPIEPDERYT